jgi:hypothetical protein
MVKNELVNFWLVCAIIIYIGWTISELRDGKEINELEYEISKLKKEIDEN